jgi:hypothetical protein
VNLSQQFPDDMWGSKARVRARYEAKVFHDPSGVLSQPDIAPLPARVKPMKVTRKSWWCGKCNMRNGNGVQVCSRCKKRGLL